MRLRLRIERNELPPVSVLWTIEPTALKQTIAQFLQRVDERVPLEGESWGLEDYAVTVGGYEAFHFGEVGECFQNEDEVVIKPLQFVDKRARTITGRDQITSDGRHLLDGVPFGRPLLKRPRRPDVWIPARKRQRVGEEIDAGEADEEVIKAIAGLEDVEDDDDDDDEEDEEDEEDDGDFEMEEEDEAEDGAAEEYSEVENEDVEEEASISTRRTRRQRVIDDEAAEAEEDDEDDEEDSDTESSGDSNDTSDDDSGSDSSDDSTSSDDNPDDSSDNSSDTSSSDSDDASSEASWNGIETSPNKPVSAPLINGDKRKASPAKRTGSQPGSIVADSEDTQPAGLPPIPPGLKFAGAPPHQGAEDTKSRNARRRDQRRLKHLKESGILSSRATMNDLRKWQSENGVDGSEVTKFVQKKHPDLTAHTKKNGVDGQTFETARQRLIDTIAAGGGVDIAQASMFNYDAPVETNEEHPVASKESLITNGASTEQEKPNDGNEFSDDDEAPEEQPSTRAAVMPEEVTEQSAEPGATTAATSSRARINLAGANRLVFGSLGVRTPKTQADKDALQKKLSARVSRNVPAKEAEFAQPEGEDDNDPDAWWDKIELSAVECCDEGVELSAPPFPFQQRWDPQYQYRKKRKNFSKARKTGNGWGGDFVESYDKYNINGEGDALNYDDPVIDEEDDSYWEEGALLGDEADEMGEEPGDDGFPALPADLTSLSTLAELDAREGDFVTYKQLVCSAATNWTPTTVDRTVKLESKADEGGWNVTFAARDKRPKKYDDEGNRVYGKFEMEGLSDDEGEDEGNMLLWSALQEPKLLQRAASE